MSAPENGDSKISSFLTVLYLCVKTIFAYADYDWGYSGVL